MSKILNAIRKSEIDIIHELQDNCPGIKDLRLMMDNQYSSYDAYNDEYILEFKTRHKVYQDTQVERIKIERNLVEAKKQGKKFLYVINDAEGIFVWSISKLAANGYDFKYITMRCPKTTSFKNREYIDKSVHNLPKRLAQWNMKWKDDSDQLDPISLFK